MKQPLDALRRTARWLGPMMIVLLAAVLATGSFHDHISAAARDGCVLCTAAHAPALPATMTATVAAPIPAPHDPPALPLLTYSRPAPHRFCSRAPPSA
jgi:hypothetical protein